MRDDLCHERAHQINTQWLSVDEISRAVPLDNKMCGGETIFSLLDNFN
jgi:hypothetical protein